MPSSQYALWLRRSLEGAPDGHERVARGFGEMPEVKEILTRCLQDQSLAIRSVYGQYLPWLLLLDPTWTRGHAGEIFPSDEAKRRLWEAGWGTYIVFCPPYDNVFDALHDQYRQAVESLSTEVKTRPAAHNPGESLAEHLMAFYWRGRLAPDDEIMNTFWRKAPPALRRHALAFVGHSLADTVGTVPGTVLERLKALWSARLGAAQEDPEAGKGEVAAFGLWLTSGKFDEEWAVSQLKEALVIARRAEDDHDVIERLSTLAERFSLQAIECLALLVEGDREGWRVHAYRELIKEMLGSVLEKGPAAAKAAAEKLIHELGRKGYFEFGELLQRG